MDPVICPNCINTIVGSQVSTPDCQVVDLNIHTKIEDEVELWTVDQDQVMYGSINWADQPEHSWPISAKNKVSIRRSSALVRGMNLLA